MERYQPRDPLRHFDRNALQRRNAFIERQPIEARAVFRREAAARGVAVEWLGASAALRDGADRLGLVQTLELPAATPA